MAKFEKLNQHQKERLSDCIDSLRIHAIPEKWKLLPGYKEQVRKTLVNVSRGLRNAGIPMVDVDKAIESIDYGREDLAYKYIYETSKIKDPVAQQLDARYGIGRGSGAVRDMFTMIVKG